MRFKTLIHTIKSNFQSNEEWTKSWESNPEYMKFMIQDYKNTDPNRLALGLIRKKSEVLSAGCGPGREARFLVQELQCKVTAIDHSAKMIELSKKAEPKAKYFVASIVDFKAKEKFDYVLCLYNTINYLPGFSERRIFIKNSYDSLKQGGKLILVTKHKYTHLGAFLRSLLSNKNFCYSPKQILRWFKELRFKLEQTKIGKDSILIIATKC